MFRLPKYQFIMYRNGCMSLYIEPGNDSCRTSLIKLVRLSSNLICRFELVPLNCKLSLDNAYKSLDPVNLVSYVLTVLGLYKLRQPK